MNSPVSSPLSPQRRALLAGVCALAVSAIVFAAEPARPTSATGDESYRIQAGDILIVSVWKEPDLQTEVLVRSDGGLSFPLTGDIVAAGMTIESLRVEIARRLEQYVPDAAVTVALKVSGGNRIYVLGKVNRPGEYPFGKPIDVMQAISLAGGMTPYASQNSVHILRRKSAAELQSIPFRYSEVEQGQSLEQNILLRGGDTVVVP